MNIINGDRLNVDAREMLEKMEKEFGEKVIEFEMKSGIKIKDIQLSRTWHGTEERKPEANAYFTEDNEDETDAIRFIISKADRKRIKEWYLSLMSEIMSKLKEILKEQYNELTNEGKTPYYGTICGPQLIYSFGETGIGEIITVRETITGRELDLSDYDNW